MRPIVGGTDAAFPLFYAVFDRIVPSANKFMATIFNAQTDQSQGVVEVTRIFRYNWGAASGRVSRLILEQQLAFITARTSGTAIPTRRVDSGVTDTFSLVTCDTNSTAVTFAANSLIRRLYAHQGDPRPEEGTDEAALVYARQAGDSGLMLRPNRGITVQNITAPGELPGSVSYVLEWHVDRDKTVF